MNLHKNHKSGNRNNKNKHPINRQIRANQVRVVLEGTSNIMSLEEALQLAFNEGLDLVQFGPGDVPTCRIINYSKFQYMEEKKRKQAASVKTKMKEIQLRPSIDDHDLEVKKNHIIEFLKKGNDVRLRMKLRGREKINSDKHGSLLLEIANQFSGLARIEYKLEPDGSLIGGLVNLKSIKTEQNSG